MSEVKNIIIDVDGTLTDGKVWYNHAGEKSKAFHSRDIWAIRELISLGYRVILMSASTWPGMEHYAKRTGAEVIHTRVKEFDEPYYCIVDDVWDLELAKKAVHSFCPVDAIDIIKDKSTVLSIKGGDGVIALFIDKLQQKES